MTNPISQQLAGCLQNAVARAKTPGAAAYIGRHDETLLWDVAGNRECVPEQKPVDKFTLYDLASLTKVIATTTAIMQLRDAGKLDLDQPVAEVIPVPAFRAFTFRHLLTHTSGLIGYDTWYKEVSSLNDIIQRLASLPLNSPPGTRRLYSDFGFMLLGKSVELLSQDSLDAYCRKHIFEPLAMSRTTYKPPEEWRDNCAATELCAWRQRVMIGEVHDEHAFAIGGISGHAGLFSTADDLGKFARAILHGYALTEKTLDEMARLGQVPAYPWQGLGWKIDPWWNSVDGFVPSRAAIGHTGWTGTNLWIDRHAGFYAILLSNSCHPSRTQRDNRLMRRAFSTGIASVCPPKTVNPHSGLDRLLWEEFEPLRGKRVALLTNTAAADLLGRSVMDVLAFDPSITVQRIFTPEHGLYAQEEAGKSVQKQKASAPIISLYGEQRQPTPDQLADIDVFLVDLPDVGSRYYTYADTMKECMAACAKAKKTVCVLDRPNPLGGTILEGPIARKFGAAVCWAPVPIRHGMTLGETALFFQKTAFAKSGLDVQVLLVDAWPREHLFHECDLAWLPPSPNIPNADTALWYVGACLFEGVNLNEGRGTESPFQFVGAPWLDAEKIAAALDPAEIPGCRIQTNAYTPKSIPGKASHPEYENQTCHGIQVEILQPPQVRAFTSAVAMLRAIRRIHPGQLSFKPSFDLLAGGPWLREQIEKDTPALELTQGLEKELREFDQKRPKLYPTMQELAAEFTAPKKGK